MYSPCQIIHSEILHTYIKYIEADFKGRNSSQPKHSDSMSLWYCWETQLGFGTGRAVCSIGVPGPLVSLLQSRDRAANPKATRDLLLGRVSSYMLAMCRFNYYQLGLNYSTEALMFGWRMGDCGRPGDNHEIDPPIMPLHWSYESQACVILFTVTERVHRQLSLTIRRTISIWRFMVL